jgi:hypothetical protein
MSYPTPNPIVPLFWPDQSALSNLLDEHEYFSRSDQYYPLRWFNAYIRSPDGLKPSPDSPTNLQVHPRDLLVHFPGPPSDHLNETLSPYLDIVESHKAKWETTLSKMEKAKLIEGMDGELRVTILVVLHRLD